LVTSKEYLKENQAFRKVFGGNPGHPLPTDRDDRDRRAISRRRRAGNAGRTTMKHIGGVLAAAGLFVATEAMEAAQAGGDANRVTLYTSAIAATGFHCNALNVSGKRLRIAISIIGGDGKHISSPETEVPTSTDANKVASNDKEPVARTDGYCKVDVFDLNDRDDVRVVMKANLIRTFDSPDGSETNIPVFLSWALEGR
jgi:hypothetical protein